MSHVGTRRLRILFVGLRTGQQRRMQLAMERLGHEVTVVDPYSVVRSNRYLALWAWHSGLLMIGGMIEGFLKREARDLGLFDVAFVDSGELITPAAVRHLRTKAGKVVLFCRDNPFVRRDGFRWRAVLSALTEYDLFVTPRQSTADAAPSFGAKRTLRVHFFADEELHQPRKPTDAERARFGAAVSFVGTWFPERGEFMQTLLDRGVPLRIIGSRWYKAKNHRQISHAVTEGYLSSEDYTAAVLSCQIAIAMLSKGNEDVSTSRSIEIPAMGRVLCAERTAEHQQLYNEGEEAVFWSDANECADLCLALLSDPARLERIAAAGHRRALLNNHWTAPTMSEILDAAVG